MVVLNIVVKAAIAIIKKASFPIDLVYRLINCFENAPPWFENVSPLLFITNAPNAIKHIPKIIVVI